MYNPAKHHIDTFNYFIHNDLRNIIDSEMPIIVNKSDKTFKINFLNPNFSKPSTVQKNMFDDDELTPLAARLKNLTYAAPIYIDIEEIIEENGEIKKQIFQRQILAKIPIPLKCDICHLVNLSREELVKTYGESENDPGGYFIVKGKERVLISQIRLGYNSPIIYLNDNNYMIESRFCNFSNMHTTLIKAELINNDIFIYSSFFKEKIHASFIFIFLEQYDIENYFFGKNSLHDKIIRRIKYFMTKKTKEEILNYSCSILKSYINDPKSTIEQIYRFELFPHILISETDEFRARNFALFLDELIITAYKKKIEERYEKDNLCNKRLEPAGILCAELFRQMFKKYCSSMIKEIEKKNTNFNCKTFIQKNQSITKKFITCFMNPSWGAQQNGYVRVGVSQILSNINYLAFFSHLQRVNIPVAKDTKNSQIRQLHPSHLLYLCGAESPEGNTIGIVLNLASKCQISTKIPSQVFKYLLKKMPMCLALNQGKNIIMGNGVAICSTNNCQDFISYFKKLRFQNIIPQKVSIFNTENKIYIYYDEGRFLYPLNDELLIDPLEKYNYNIIDMLKNPEDMFGICTGIIPAVNHSPAPRACYGSGMVKQAIGIPSYNFLNKLDTTFYYLHYPQKQLTITKLAKEIKLEEMPFGVNAIVAICSFGFNQEDACIMNKSAIDRGLFVTTTFNTHTEEETSEIKIGLISFEFQKKSNNYSHLEVNGLPKIGSKLKMDDVIICKYTIENEKIIDLSTVVKKKCVIVTTIYETKNESGLKLVKVVTRELCIPEVGDKFSSTISQKGVCGLILSSEDLPFTSQGIVPDIIINPHAIPSRMTISQLIECVLGKEKCFDGQEKDCTAFNQYKDIGKALEDSGFDSSGEETIYCGITGNEFKSKIFIGPTYYMRLKHLVNEKIHSRNIGVVTSLTRSAPEGRRRDGGLKFGEMERDALIAHGTTQMLLERLFKYVDDFSVTICNYCNEIIYGTQCKICFKNTVKIEIPYIFKLIRQELGAMNIKIGLNTNFGLSNKRYKTNKNIIKNNDNINNEDEIDDLEEEEDENNDIDDEIVTDIIDDGIGDF